MCYPVLYDTWRHVGLEHLRDADSSLRLVQLQDGANDASGGAHGRVQHVNVVRLFFKKRQYNSLDEDRARGILENNHLGVHLLSLSVANQ